MDDKLFENLEESISKDRLEHYSKIFSINDKKTIIQKYFLNVELSKALYFTLQTLETTLRNNIHRVLSKKLNNEFWFEDSTFMNPRTIDKKDVLKARSNIHNSKVKTSGRIISELSFGFWSYLFGKYYEQKIWNRYIKLIFPNIPKSMSKRNKLSERINTIKNLRNKVFHFDTIISIKNLSELYNQILEVIYWLNEDVYRLAIAFDEFENIYKNEEEIIKEKLEIELGGQMKNYEIKITLLLKKDIKYEDVHYEISSNINKAMSQDERLKQIHKNNKYKPYCIGSLYPFDIQTKVYKANQVYVLTIRSIKQEFLNSLRLSLKSSKTLDFSVLAIESNELNQKFIESVYTLTPSVISITNEQGEIRNWTKAESSLEFVKRRIKDNLEKKYKEFFNEEIKAPDDFITMINLENKTPYVFNYKKTKIFTNKFKIAINSDEISQKLINFAFGVGILEKNSLGFGFITKGK